jgi:glutaredoxin
MSPRRPLTLVPPSLALLTALLLATPPAFALYKVVGPDGKVTYTDRPPVGTEARRLGAPAGAGEAGPALPFELRQIVARFPVTLYTTGNCAACDTGRALLKRRGVPFTEKTVSTAEDNDALMRLEGSGNLPVLRIGGQRLTGFAENDWSGYLDAAGYPATSRLPAGWRDPEPSALAGKAPAKPAASPAAPVMPASPPAPETPAPGGFRF